VYFVYSVQCCIISATSLIPVTVNCNGRSALCLSLLFLRGLGPAFWGWSGDNQGAFGLAFSVGGFELHVLVGMTGTVLLCVTWCLVCV
jgi:hypothetical protein